MKNEIKMLYASQLGSLDGIELDNTDDVIEKSVVIEMLKEQIELTKKIEISLKAQEEKHKEEMEKLVDVIGYNVSDSGFYIVKRINGKNVWINTESNIPQFEYNTSEIIDILLKK